MSRERITEAVLVILIIACIFVYYQTTLYTKNTESFVDSTGGATPTSLASYGILDLEEAKRVVDGTWNEPWDAFPKSATTILYYSVFSQKSRNTLLTSPYTWTNYSPVFAQKLPANCKVDDSKIVFTNKSIVGQTLGNYVEGISLHNNKGNGPLAMNMGINAVAGSAQAFSIAMLLRFNNLEKYVGETVLDRVDLLNMKANTANNNGIKVTLDVSNTALPDRYRVNFRVLFGSDGEKFVSADPIDIQANTSMYYVFCLSRENALIRLSLYGIDTLVNTSPSSIATFEFIYTDPVEFSNMPMQLGSGGMNIANLLSVAICQTGLSSKDLEDIAGYWRALLLKTGATAFALAQQALALSACPFSDSNVCTACTDVKDWRNVNQLLISSEGCKKAYDSYCTASNNMPGCECYSTNGMQRQECTSLRNIIKGQSACSLTEINDYIRKNNVCATSNVDTPVSSANYNRMQLVRDYITSEEYDTTVTPAPRELGFWEWFFGI